MGEGEGEAEAENQISPRHAQFAPSTHTHMQTHIRTHTLMCLLVGRIFLSSLSQLALAAIFQTSAGANQVCDHVVCIDTCTTRTTTATQKQQTEHSTRKYINRAGTGTAPEAEPGTGPVQVFLLPLNGR